jgi:hypothetical protein
VLHKSHTSYSFYAGRDFVEVLTKYRVQHLSHGDVRFVAAEILKQPGNAMIHSSRRDRKTKAIAEALAMIAGAHPELESHRLRPVGETDKWLWESATEFCTAMDRYAEHAMEIKSENRRPPAAPMPAAPLYKETPRHSRGISLHSNESIS